MMGSISVASTWGTMLEGPVLEDSDGEESKVREYGGSEVDFWLHKYESKRMGY